MALRIRYQYATGSTLGYSVERLKDGNLFDFADLTFKPTPATLVQSLPEDTGAFAGRYKVNLSPTPVAQFTDGDYALTIHDQAASNSVVGQMAVTVCSGDDATVIPTDPWGTALPGSYPSSTAGAILGLHLDAPISSRSTFAGGVVAGVASPVTVGTVNDKSGYSLAGGVTVSAYAAGLDPASVLFAAALPVSPSVGTAGEALKLADTRLDAPVSSRSTFAGGVVAGVASPVTVGTVNDKSGYLLASAGLDAVVVEPGVNARQALAPILAAVAGTLSGSGTGTVVIHAGMAQANGADAGVGTSGPTRILAMTDDNGNRSSVTLYLPA